jgi:hypothetical protein
VKIETQSGIAALFARVGRDAVTQHKEPQSLHQAPSGASGSNSRQSLSS